jgi:hypothetical protein
LSGQKWDESTNIFTDIFKANLLRLNPELSSGDVYRVFDEVALSLQNEDLGKSFYEKLVDQSGIRLIDFENFVSQKQLEGYTIGYLFFFHLYDQFYIHLAKVRPSLFRMQYDVISSAFRLSEHGNIQFLLCLS